MYRVSTGYTVGDAMTMNPITIPGNKTLRDAAKIMSKEHVGSLLVTEEGKIIGRLRFNVVQVDTEPVLSTMVK